MANIKKVMPKSVRKRVNDKLDIRHREKDRLLELQEKAKRGDLKFKPKLGTDGADLTGRLEKAREEIAGGNMASMKKLLPLLFNLSGKPYKIKNHFPFEPFYYTRLARSMVWKTARQVSKSTNQASQGILCSNLIPYFNTLFVTPQYELIRRFSTNYVRPFIDQSPVKPLLIDTSCANNVLQRSFKNHSTMYFSFAYMDCDRTRGLNCSKVAYDEVQDMDPKFIPIIFETMSASDWKLSQYTGTPKTLENTIEQLWITSSMGEWAIKCGCGYWNIPSLDHDLDGMLGPTFVTRKIDESAPGIVCAKCGKPVNPRKGVWVHRHPELRYKFSGYHVPQMVMPMHYADEEAWMILQGKRQGFGRTPINVFYNEACGESFDTGSRLLSVTELRAAATLGENTIEEAIRVRGMYKCVVLAVDWGGGGEEEISFTCAALCGMRPDGKIDVIYGWRSLTPNAPLQEAVEILKLLKLFRVEYLVHDFGGAGNLREAIIAQSGFPLERIIPITYQRTNYGPMMSYKEYNELTGKRDYYQLDKARSLQYVCEMIKCKQVQTFRYDYHGPDRAGLLHDWLALVEDMVDSRMGHDVFTIIHNKMAGPDDFAQAMNIGVCALCNIYDHWPDLALVAGLQVDPSILASISPVGDVQWDDW